MELGTILNIMAQYKLTADELLLIYLTLCAQDGHTQYFNQWFNNGGQSRLRELFNSLKEKGIIHKNYNPQSYIPDEIEFNQNFIKQYFKQAGILGKELFDNYEPFGYANGKTYSLRNIAKKFFSLDDFYFWYSSNIGHSIKKHKEIMEILQWARAHKLVKVSILEFVASHKWEEFELMRKEGYTAEQVSSYDIYQDV